MSRTSAHTWKGFDNEPFPFCTVSADRCRHGPGPGACGCPGANTRRLRRRPRASTRPPSTRPPTPAPTSTSTPAATGSRTIPFPRDQVRWGVPSPSSRNATATCSGRSSMPPPKAPRRRWRSSTATIYAACMNTDLVEKKGLQPLQARSRSASPLCRMRRTWQPWSANSAVRRPRPAVPLRRAAGRKGLLETDRQHFPGRPLAARPRLLPGRQQRSTTIRKQYMRARDQDVYPGRRCARAGRERSRRGDEDRNRPGQSLHRPRGTARSGEALPHLYGGRFSETRSRFRLLARTSKTSRSGTSTR